MNTEVTVKLTEEDIKTAVQEFVKKTHPEYAIQFVQLFTEETWEGMDALARGDMDEAERIVRKQAKEDLERARRDIEKAYSKKGNE
jgi:23S rRNA pseudoU1915 N3-methylase RlmH